MKKLLLLPAFSLLLILSVGSPLQADQPYVQVNSMQSASPLQSKSPFIGESFIGWASKPTYAVSHVFARRIGGGKQLDISPGKGPQINPLAFMDRAIWVEGLHGKYSIKSRLLEESEVVRLSQSRINHNIAPSVSANGWLVWVDEASGRITGAKLPGDNKLRSEPKNVRIGSSSGPVEDIAIGENLLVWIEREGKHWLLKKLDVTSGRQATVLNSPNRLQGVATDGRRIAVLVNQPDGAWWLKLIEPTKAKSGATDGVLTTAADSSSSPVFTAGMLFWKEAEGSNQAVRGRVLKTGRMKTLVSWSGSITYLSASGRTVAWSAMSEKNEYGFDSDIYAVRILGDVNSKQLRFSEPVKISTGEPAVSSYYEPDFDDHHVVWTDSRRAYFSIFARDTKSGKEFDVFADKNNYMVRPVVEGSRVAWILGGRNGGSLMVKDIESGELIRVDSSHQQLYRSPQLDKDYFAWLSVVRLDQFDETTQLMISSNQESLSDLINGSSVLESDQNQDSPYLAGSRIAWSQSGGAAGSKDIFTKNLKTNQVTTVAATANDEDIPRFSGTGIAWLETAGDIEKIKYKRWEENKTITVTQSTGLELAGVDGDNVVWMNLDDPLRPILSMNMRTGKTTTLVSGDWVKDNLIAKDGYLAYEDRRRDNFNIHLVPLRGQGIPAGLLRKLPEPEFKVLPKITFKDPAAEEPTRSAPKGPGCGGLVGG